MFRVLLIIITCLLFNNDEKVLLLVRMIRVEFAMVVSLVVDCDRRDAILRPQEVLAGRFTFEEAHRVQDYKAVISDVH